MELQRLFLFALILNPLKMIYTEKHNTVFMLCRGDRDRSIDFALFSAFRYFSLPPEEREKTGTIDPMCELFPKQVSCYYSRYGMGGGLDSRHAMCVLGHNIMNDKVFLLIWVWHWVLVLIGINRAITRSFQLISAKVRYFLIKVKMDRYFKNNRHIKHIMHYVMNCSIGDWFVLYQMSKNLNKRYFAEFLALVAMTVDPDPNIEAEEPEIHLSPEEIERIKSSSSSNDGSSSKNKSGESTDEDDEDEGDDEDGEKKSSFLMNMSEDIEGCDGGGGGGGSSLTGKQRMLIKLGKKAKSANKGAMMAAMAAKRARRK